MGAATGVHGVGVEIGGWWEEDLVVDCDFGPAEERDQLVGGGDGEGFDEGAVEAADVGFVAYSFCESPIGHEALGGILGPS